MPYTFPPRPELTRDYPAIDGIERPLGPATTMECKTSGEYYPWRRPGKPAMRDDLLELLSLPPAEFNRKISDWRTVVTARLEQLRVITSVPNLRQEQSGSTFHSYTQLSNEQQYLEEALKHLQALTDRYAERTEVQ